MLDFNIFPKEKVVVGMSSNVDGSMRVFMDDRDKETKVRREAFVASLGLEGLRLISPVLSHSDRILTVTSKDTDRKLECDGLVTNDPGVVLAVTAADCLPVFFYDSKNKVVGVAHAGWRGLENGVIANTVETMVREFGSKLDDIKVGVGPSIGKCHFEVKSDILPSFKPYLSEALINREGKMFLDLKYIAKEKIKDSGVLASNIEVSEDCTYCMPEKYFSNRRDKPEIIEAMLAVISLSQPA